VKKLSPARILRRGKRAALAQVHSYWRKRAVVKDTVLYESFAGNGMLCNPEAIFRALLQAPDLAGLLHTWVLSSFADYRATMAEFAGHDNVRFVQRGSAAYYRALATNEYLVNNATFPTEFSKRAGQTYLNTWHGTPLKRMGFDMPDGPMESANTLRNFVSADYLLSQNPFMTEAMYAGAYKLDGIYRGTFIEEGYPRVDRQFLDDAGVAGARQTLEAAGIRLDGRRLLVYAPTWRGASFTSPDDNLDEILEARRQLEQSLDGTKWCVALKLHQAAHAQAADRPEARGVLVPNSVPTNVVLGITDILVTDYSSIFFDFLLTGRPIVFYTPDQADYGDARGLYQDPAQLPGPVFTGIGETMRALAELSVHGPSEEDRERSDAARQKYGPWDDGNAADRVIDVVFRGASSGHRVRRFPDDARPKILLHLGGMRPNGITSAAINLVNSIDHSRYDVSVTYPRRAAARRMLAERSIDPAIRHFPRVGGMNGSKILHAKRRLADRLGRTSLDLTDPAEYALWDEEWVRCFGDSRFDHVIDFSGYGPFWARLLLHSPPASRAIWLHNDMAADAQRSVHGKLVHNRSLNVVFSHYRDYDKLVSVSSSLSAINRQKLARWAPAEKFVAAPNCIDGATILAMGEEEILAPAAGGEADATANIGLDPSDFGKPGQKVFVTAGRLSTEKNHSRLIRAFAVVHAQHPSTRLVIIGSGPLRSTLAELIGELDLVGAVTLTGQLSNPYAVMRRADCFVLSSDYEGQPMVLLEAAVLGLPVVTVDFGSVADALPAGAALVVRQTIEDLAAGMAEFLAGNVPPAEFDYTTYNGSAVEAFYRVLG
jgi:CDP-glycerol glycerophosphotransferase